MLRKAIELYKGAVFMYGKEQAWLKDITFHYKARYIRTVERLLHELSNRKDCSYSKKAFPWDNACMESFHSIIKREWLNRFKIRNYRQAYHLIFEYVEASYNTKRIHSHYNYMSLDKFERVYEILT